MFLVSGGYIKDVCSSFCTHLCPITQNFPMWETQLMVQLVQSSELQVLMTILHNDTLQYGDAPEWWTEKIEEIHWQDHWELERFWLLNQIEWRTLFASRSWRQN